MEFETFKTKSNISFTLREIGGQMGFDWPELFSASVGIVFVLDLADFVSLPAATFAVLQLLVHENVKGKPFALVCNKSDAAPLHAQSGLANVLRVDDMLKEHKNLTMFKTSVLNTDGTLPLFEWIVDTAALSVKKK